MRPVLLEIEGWRLYSYTVFLTLAFVLGFLWTLHEAKKLKIPVERLTPLIFPIFMVSMLGARLYFAIGAWIATDFEHPLSTFLIRGGLAFYGGLLATLLFLYALAPRLKIPRPQLFNAFAPGLLLAQAIGRLGCFFNGCCYGKNCTLPWGVLSQSPQGSPSYGLHLHPSQLYEITGIIPLLWLCSRANTRPCARWPAWKIYLLGYGCLRFGVEFTRGDPIRGFLGFLSLSQWVSLALIALSLFLDFRAKGNHNETPHEA